MASSVALRFNDIVFAVVSVVECRNGKKNVQLERYGGQADAQRTRFDQAASHIHTYHIFQSYEYSVATST